MEITMYKDEFVGILGGQRATVEEVGFLMGGGRVK